MAQPFSPRPIPAFREDGSLIPSKNLFEAYFKSIQRMPILLMHDRTDTTRNVASLGEEGVVESARTTT